MKILHTFDFFSPHGGGTVDVLYKLSRIQAQKGHKVTIYTSDFNLDQDYINSLPEVKIYPFHCISSAGQFYVTPSLAETVEKNIKNFDIIHMHCFRSFQNIVILHYAKKYHIPYVLDTHGSLPRKVAGELGFKWLLRWLFDIFFGNRIMSNATRVVAQNEFAVRENKRFGLEDGRIVLIPLFFPVEDFVNLPAAGQFRKQYGIVKKKVIMFIGRINSIKGLDFLVKSFYELLQYRQDIVLSIVGPDDGYKNELENLVCELNLSTSVMFTGFLGGQEKLAALVDADVVIQPSRYEQAAWAPIEAVLCGTPVIVSSNSGSGEDINRMNAGYLVDYGDKNQMVQMIQTILDEPEKVREKVNRAKEYIVNNLRFSDNVKSYERLYQESIQARQKARREE
ncbi:glycosyltransferase family 4 protein [Chloroflexota bacterium]